MNFQHLSLLNKMKLLKEKDKTLQEMAHVMLNSKKLTRCLWAKALNTACYIINYVYLRPDTKKTSYEL